MTVTSDPPELCRPEEFPSEMGTDTARIIVSIKKIVTAFVLILSLVLCSVYIY